MGITGTDVAKEAADMVLLHNTATIVSSVEQGRVIFDNLLRFVKFSIGGNLGKVLVMLLATLLGVRVALLPLQSLWLNLLTDGLVGLGLGMEPAEAGTIRRSPRSPQASLLDGGAQRHIIWVSLLIAVVTLAVGFFYYEPEDRTWQTMMFTTLASTQVGHALGLRATVERSRRWPGSPRSRSCSRSRRSMFPFWMSSLRWCRSRHRISFSVSY
jgi:Ca2+-transporting ATPase